MTAMSNDPNVPSRLPRERSASTAALDDPGTRRLLALVTARGQLAEQLDCYMRCDCGPSLVRCQIVLDKLLFDVDRSIDLYVSGQIGTDGDPEVRAAAYGVLIAHFLGNTDAGSQLGPHLGDLVRMRTETLQPNASPQDQVGCVCGHDCIQPDGPIWVLLEQIRDLLWWHTPGAQVLEPPTIDGTRAFELDDFDIRDDNGVTQGITGFTPATFYDLGERVKDVLDRITPHTSAPVDDLVVPAADAETKADLLELIRRLGLMHQELCIQRSMDKQWDGLLRTLAPSCLRFGNDQVLAAQGILDGAIGRVELDASCPSYKPDIPPHFETSLAGIPYLRNSEG